jgi:hypothetical protein
MYLQVSSVSQTSLSGGFWKTVQFIYVPAGVFYVADKLVGDFLENRIYK